MIVEDPVLPVESTAQPAEPPDDQVELADVERWQHRVSQDKARWEEDFNRMKENMEFASGLQWDQQTAIKDKEGRYVANLSLREVEGKVASLYARNPQAEATRRERMDYALWDGSIEMLQDAFIRVQQYGPLDIEAFAIWQDFMSGKQQQRMLDKVCKTFEIAFKHQIDAASPDFKERMKQLVRTVITCGVGYCIPSLVRQNVPENPDTVNTPNRLVDKARLMRLIGEKIDQGDVSEEDAQVATLRSLGMSLGVSATEQANALEEHLEFDFPPATSIMPDRRCRSLKEFIAARWLTQEFTMSLDDVNAFFGLSGDRMVKAGGDLVEVNEKQTTVETQSEQDKNDPAKEPEIYVWHIINKVDGTHFYIADGYRYYLRAPAPIEPVVTGFWQVFALTFNDIVSEPDTKTSIYPPSDIDLLRDPQKEWNRTRDALRAQRNANAPKYLVRKGLLTDNDKRKLREAEPNEVIELEGVPPDQPLSEVVVVMQTARIDPAVYDTAPLEQDLMLSTGMQQANLGPAQPDVTATVGTIAEQSRLQTTSSNVDDVDGFLTRITKCCWELMLQGFSPQNIQRIAGIGSAWPTTNISEYLNAIEVQIKAASSGRPNKAMRTQMITQLVPLLLNAGANPIAVIEEIVDAMSDGQLDPQKFYPMPGQFSSQQPGQSPQSGPSAPSGAPPMQAGPGPQATQGGPQDQNLLGQQLANGGPPMLSSGGNMPQ